MTDLELLPLFPIIHSIDLTPALVQILVVLNISIQKQLLYATVREYPGSHFTTHA